MNEFEKLHSKLKLIVWRDDRDIAKRYYIEGLRRAAEIAKSLTAHTGVSYRAVDVLQAIEAEAARVEGEK